MVVISGWAFQGHQTNIQHFGEKEGFSEALVVHMIQDSNGYIWLATWDGLRRYDGYRFETFKARPGDCSPLESNRISYVEETADHQIICWSNDKYYLFNPQTAVFTLYNNKVKPHLYHPTAKAKQKIQNIKEYQNIEFSILLEDQQNGIWVNSHRGLERISDIPAPIMTLKDSPHEEVVSALYADVKGYLWVADKSGYIRLINKNKQTQYLTANGSLSSTRTSFGYAAYCIYKDSKGRIWIGTKPDGLFKLTPNQVGYQVEHFFNDPKDAFSISCNSVYDIAEDAKNRLVIATYGGGLNIAEQLPNGQTRFVHCGNLLKQFPQKGLRSRCLSVLPDGTLLLGTNDGLYTASLNNPYEKMVFYINNRRPNDVHSISNNFVTEILQAKSGRIYITTSGGGTDVVISHKLLCDTIQFQHFSVAEGISSDMNQTLTEDNNGNVWIVSAGSLSMLNPKTGLATNYWNLFPDAGELFTEATPAVLLNGTLVFSTTLGILSITPNEMKKSNFVPRIVFDCAQEVFLSPDEKDFSIRFAALDYNKNEEIVYAYKLDGIDSEWRYTRSNELNYARLAPGDYTLHIKSTNGDGVWTDNEQTIILHRSAHFNETPWAWMLYGLLLTCFVIGGFSAIRYVRRLKRELKNVQLSSKEQIELLGERIKELLPITEEVKEITEDNETLSHEDCLFASRIKEYVENNIDNADLSVIDIAQAMYVSRTVLFVRMKHIFNSSPNNYVLNTRINYAKKLLLTTDMRVSDVAYKSGFSDPKYFSRCFKKLTGDLPKEFAEGKK